MRATLPTYMARIRIIQYLQYVGEAMRRPAVPAVAVLAALSCAYLTLAPVPAEPVAWQPPPNPGHAGQYGRNTRLAGLARIALAGAAPEHVALGPDGWLYAAVEGGAILRMRPDGSAQAIWANSGGRVLGFGWLPDGRLVAADALRGLVAFELAAPHRMTVLADAMPDGDPIRFADALTVARDGTVYFTDASRRHAPARYGSPAEASIHDFIEHVPTGRVLAWRPDRGKAELVAGGLSFANGIVLSRDERSLYVAETGNYRVWRIDPRARGLDLARSPSAHSGAAGEDAPARVLLDGLPGFPDNLTRGMDGRIWLGLAGPRTPQVDAMAGHPFLRKLALRLPRALWPVPSAYGHVLAFSEDGRVVADLQDPSGAYPGTTGVLETADRLYIQSIQAAALGWLPKARAGL
jgi:sugar lactone lactonase YvrE